MSPHYTFTRNFIHDSHLLDIDPRFLINTDGRNAAVDPLLEFSYSPDPSFPRSLPSPASETETLDLQSSVLTNRPPVHALFFVAEKGHSILLSCHSAILEYA